MSVLECFLTDDITSVGCAPIYDCESQKPILFATPAGIGQITTPRSGVEVPLFFIDDADLEGYAAEILVRAAVSNRKNQVFNMSDVRRTFEKRDLDFGQAFSRKDYQSIPKGLHIAVSVPEYLGRLVISGGRRGLALLNFSSVIGYQTGVGRRRRG